MTVLFQQLGDIMRAAPIIPVITVNHIDEAVPLAEALVAGGLPVLEITLRTECALAAIAAVAEVPNAIVGAGTVLTGDQLQKVKAAGGTFCVSPGITEKLLQAALAAEMNLLPGVATASEVMNLLEKGLIYMKFFPAEAAGGIPMLKSLGAPLPQARFCPTGGVSLKNAHKYLALENVLCAGGSWVCPADAIKAKDWTRITELAREAADLK